MMSTYPGFSTMIAATIVAMRPPMMRVVTDPAKNIPAKRAAILSVADNEKMSITLYSGCRYMQVLISHLHQVSIC